MSARRTIPTLELPDGWEERLQITWVAPPELIQVEGQEPQAAPRNNIVLSLTPARASNPAEARDEFLEQTRTAVALMKEVKGELEFADGAQGSSVEVEFEVKTVKLRQTHLFRIDDGLLAQLVITVDADGVSDELEDQLLKAARGYKPATPAIAG